MMKRTVVCAAAAALGLAVIFLDGCAGRTKPARFYVLSSVAESGSGMKDFSADSRDITIGISRISLPKYLRRQQIVSRTGSNELHLAEYDRWAGKFEEDIGRVIAENLRYILGTDRVLLYPSMASMRPDYTVKIEINRFDGRLGGDMELVGSWIISAADNEAVYSVRSISISEPAAGRSYTALVAAQSRALAVFSRELADAIKVLTGG